MNTIAKMIPRRQFIEHLLVKAGRRCSCNAHELLMQPPVAVNKRSLALVASHNQTNTGGAPMSRTLGRILVGVVAVFLLYLVLRAASPSRAAGSEPDTMCFASRIGLKCNDP
jgi:hypothetical protein